MLDKLLKEIVVLTVGKQAEPIAELLNTPKYVNEFNIAKKLGITINQTRNILYKVSDFGLVSSERKKDKKKGWYTYFWKFEILKCLEFLKNLLEESEEELKKEIAARERSVYYVCNLCNLEYSEGDALLMDFTCDECGELFETKDNSKFVKEMNANLKKISEKKAIIDEEIEKEMGKLDKKKAVQLKKEEKEKEAKKEEARKKREAKRKERDLLKPKVEKKVAKKKTVEKKAVKKKTVSKSPATKKKTVEKKTVSKKAPSKKVVAKKKIEKKKVSKKKN